MDSCLCNNRCEEKYGRLSLRQQEKHLLAFTLADSSILFHSQRQSLGLPVHGAMEMEPKSHYTASTMRACTFSRISAHLRRMSAH